MRAVTCAVAPGPCVTPKIRARYVRAGLERAATATVEYVAPRVHAIAAHCRRASAAAALG